MRAVLIDDELYSLQYLSKICSQIPHLQVQKTFLNAGEALKYLSQNEVDLILTDIEMPGLNGMEAVKELRKLQPNVGVIFVTGYEQYAFEAFQVQAVGYITKPCSEDELMGAIKRAEVLQIKKCSIEIKTFGLFSVNIDGVPCRFANRKAEEMLAYLVDKKGSVVSMEQLIDVLWEERSYDDMVKRLYRKATAYLNQVFAGKDFFVSERGQCYVMPEKADCDFYRFLENPASQAEYYDGEYMSQYSWAEVTNGKISRILQNRGLY